MEMKDFAIETEILYDVQYFLMDLAFLNLILNFNKANILGI